MRLVLDMGDNEKIDLSKKDKGKEHDDHWRPGIANAPQNASVDLVQAGKESEPTVRSDEKGAIINNVWICIENPNDLRGKAECRQSQDQRPDFRHFHGDLMTLLDAGKIPGPGVLPSKGRNS